MAQQNILKIVQTVAGRLGINKPNTAVGSTDIQVVQLLDLANEEGQELASRFDWQVLTREKTFTSIASDDQGLLVGGTILNAADGFRNIINDTIFDRTQRVQVGGPLSPRIWQALKGTAALQGFYPQYRLRGGHLMLFPAPTAGRTLAFEYISENWASVLAGDVYKATFTLDDDYPLLDSQLITAGLMWRWKAAKGLDFGQDFEKYENRVLDAMTRDKTARTVDMGGARTDEANPAILVQRGNWSL